MTIAQKPLVIIEHQRKTELYLWKTIQKSEKQQNQLEFMEGNTKMEIMDTQ